jgi:hypothetical protein
VPRDGICTTWNMGISLRMSELDKYVICSMSGGIYALNIDTSLRAYYKRGEKTSQLGSQQLLLM